MGYYNNPEKTSISFIQNPLHSAYPDLAYKTGDIVVQDSSSGYSFSGRVDDQIKKMGQVELEEIEAAADRLRAFTKTQLLRY